MSNIGGAYFFERLILRKPVDKLVLSAIFELPVKFCVGYRWCLFFSEVNSTSGSRIYENQLAYGKIRYIVSIPHL